MTKPTTASPCGALTHNGAPCQSPALAGSSFCFHHDPARAVERLEARSKGGRARHGRRIGPTGVAEDISVRTPDEVLSLLEEAINNTRRLESSLGQARTLGYLGLAVCKALEMSELAERIAALEAILKARS